MYTYEVDPQAMFDDRYQQFEKFGIARDDIERVRTAVTEMWADAPGGWVYEWSALAQSYADSGDHATAATAYGFAKFPCLNSPARVNAMANQLEQYELAAKDFPVQFERRIIELPYLGGTIAVPVHLYSSDGDYSARPVLIASGGVDTFKMDFHPWCLALTMKAGVTALAFDNPGTGECPVALDEHSDDLIRGIAEHARSIGDGRVAHFGMSFGGNFAAMTGLSATVDCAVDLGGPVVRAFDADHAAKLPYGMHDILGNAMGWDRSPTLDELSRELQNLSRRDLLTRRAGAPMLVINGADDYFVPQSDTLIFQNRRHTEVHLIPGTGHVAMSRAADVVPMIIGWLRRQFAEL
ncbi:alpha/beta fold hydrolase [Mycolicibacterium stellerae]|uniref:alpha/beta fold hydrolase n=1 Tax=Mycolicibacterium stellerae TaxID=2358193 RepID=UPI000F0B2488|nr:alpha/beta fold hydrolase [Mycolicibacterium stellerae]